MASTGIACTLSTCESPVQNIKEKLRPMKLNLERFRHQNSAIQNNFARKPSNSNEHKITKCVFGFQPKRPQVLSVL